MTARAIALGAAMVLSVGCGSAHSQYARSTAVPGELVWRFDERLQVTQNGAVVSEAGRWDGLAAAVSCVPRAKTWAEEATARHRKGTRTLWASVIVGVAAIATGAVIAFSDTGSDSRVLGGLGLATGGMIFSVSAGAAGIGMRLGGMARGIDAVNLYNDEIAAGARCAP